MWKAWCEGQWDSQGEVGKWQSLSQITVPVKDNKSASFFYWGLDLREWRVWDSEEERVGRDLVKLG